MSMNVMQRWIVQAITVAAVVVAPVARAEALAPDALIKQVSNEVIDTVKSDKAIQAGDVNKIIALVDAKVMPNVNFQRMTASAVGRNWRTATPEQQKRLQEEFKILLVRTEIKGKGEPIQLDYRMEKLADGWKIYDVNVAGVWLVEQYKNNFAQEISTVGIDGLITKLADKNKAAAATRNAKG
jgi:phospholipid transport system substrate-binding protein